MATFIIVCVAVYFAYVTGYGFGWSDGFKVRDDIAREFSVRRGGS